MRNAVSIRDDLLAVERRIAGRQRDEVTLVAVSKTKPAAMIEEAIAAGVTEVGENRVQEARDKKPLVHGSARWHLIGHLQSNKAKDAVRLFDVIQTIDSVELAEKVARAAASAGKVQEVLIEVNIGDEPQKSGALPADVERILVVPVTQRSDDQRASPLRRSANGTTCLSKYWNGSSPSTPT